MSSRMRRPETLTLQITRGDWLLCKKHLTAGEQRAIFRRMIRNGVTGDQIDSVQVGLSKIIGYLLDWSVTDADDKPVVIRDQPEEVVASALDNLETDSFTEILQAIEKHEAAMDAERAVQRQSPFGGNVSSPISPSLSSSAGDMSGLTTSTEMSTK